MADSGISKTRSIITLLVLLNESYIKDSRRKNEIFCGICYIIEKMYEDKEISEQEAINLKKYIRDNKPTEECSNFFYLFTKHHQPYFFYCGDYHIRLRFILYLIFKEEINSMIEILEKYDGKKGIGLCTLANYTHSYIQSEKPTPVRNVKFYRFRLGPYWWRNGDTQIRVRFLKYLLKRLEKKIFKNYNNFIFMYYASSPC